MQYLWLAIASAVVVAVVGAVIGIRRSTGTVQNRAIALSFGTLGFVGIAACAVAMNGFEEFAPVFALAIVGFPLAVYAVVVVTAGGEGASIGRVRPASRARSGATAARYRQIVHMPVSDFPPKVESRHRAPDAIRAASAKAAEDCPKRQAGASFEGAFELAVVLDSQSKPEPKMDMKLAPEPQQSPAPRSVPLIEPLVEPAAESKSEPAVKPAAEPEKPQPIELALKPQRKSEPRPQPAPAPRQALAQSRDLSFAMCFDKAILLKEAGAFLAAARLFAESADHAASSGCRRRARFEELSCYVRADQAERARTLACALREQTGTMTKIERVKLDAVLRML